MGYPRDLDSYSNAELVTELANRLNHRNNGECDYCRRTFGVKPVCRHVDRHHNRELLPCLCCGAVTKKRDADGSPICDVMSKATEGGHHG